MSSADEGTALRNRIDTYVMHRFTIPLLKAVLSTFGLGLSGKKADLQDRLMEYVDLRLSNYDIQAVRRLLQACVDTDNNQGGSSSRSAGRPAGPSLQHPIMNVYSPYRTNGHASTYTQLVNTIDGNRPTDPRLRFNEPFGSHQPVQRANMPLSFQQSPFFNLKKTMGPNIMFSPPYGRSRIRHEYAITVSPEEIDQLKAGTRKIYVLSQEYRKGETLRPVYFPFNFELILNHTPVHANTRGIKGQPGTARPVDLTQAIIENARLRTHRIEVGMALNSDPTKDDNTSSKSFGIAVYLVEPRPLSLLVAEIEQRPHNSLEAVIEQIKGENDNDDIVAMETVHSLKDPVGLTRIKVPVRSTRCTHIDCFDCEFYLQLQQQAPTWKCPICNRVITYNSLAMDDYFAQILKDTDRDVEEINVFPDGTWNVKSREAPSDDDSDDEDLHRPVKKAKAEPEIIDLDDSSDDNTEEELFGPRSTEPPMGTTQTQQSTSSQQNEQNETTSGGPRIFINIRQPPRRHSEGSTPSGPLSDSPATHLTSSPAATPAAASSATPAASSATASAVPNAAPSVAPSATPSATPVATPVATPAAASTAPQASPTASSTPASVVSPASPVRSAPSGSPAIQPTASPVASNNVPIINRSPKNNASAKSGIVSDPRPQPSYVSDPRPQPGYASDLQTRPSYVSDPRPQPGNKSPFMNWSSPNQAVNQDSSAPVRQMTPGQQAQRRLETHILTDSTGPALNSSPETERRHSRSALFGGTSAAPAPEPQQTGSSSLFHNARLATTSSEKPKGYTREWTGFDRTLDWSWRETPESPATPSTEPVQSALPAETPAPARSSPAMDLRSSVEIVSQAPATIQAPSIPQEEQVIDLTEDD